MSTNEKKLPATASTPSNRRSSSSFDSLASSVKSPRTARFAEATSVYSPIDGRSPFADPPHINHYQPQPSDVGLSHVSGVGMEETEPRGGVGLAPPTPLSPQPPLKSALKSPGAPPRTPATAILSPTFREEQVLEKSESHTDKEQARDLVRIEPCASPSLRTLIRR